MRVTAFHVTTSAVMLVVLILAFTRYKGNLETNWPVFFYLGMVMHAQAFDGGYEMAWVYAGTLMGLLLRFEFLSGWVLRLVRLLEIAILCYFEWRSCMMLLT